MVIGENAPGHVVVEGSLAADLPEGLEAQSEAMKERLSEYAPRGEGMNVAPGRWPNQTFREPRVEVYWETADGRVRPAEDVVSPRLAGEDSGFALLPAIGEQRDVIHPVAAMYATWLALSSLARYHPDDWQRALDRDRAATAIAIEEAIDLTLELLPYSVKVLLPG
jgi:hypothetical protein